MSGCRIGKIKLKSGAEVRRLPTAAQPDAMKRGLVEAAVDTNALFGAGEVGSYAVVAIGMGGAMVVSFGFREACPIGATTLPAVAADAIRRELIARGFWE